MRSTARRFCAVAIVSLTVVRPQSAPGQRQSSLSEPLGHPLATSAEKPASTVTNKPARESSWPRVYIDDVYVRDAAKGALKRASERLEASKCQSLLVEFLDEQGRPLAEGLTTLGVTLQNYLRLLIFMDGELRPQCRQHGVLAFTATGSRIVHLCGQAFKHRSRANAQEASATIIHELLHSLGLGENPPSPRHITDRVQRLCW